MNKRTLHRDLYSGKYRQRREKSKQERLQAQQKNTKIARFVAIFLCPFKALLRKLTFNPVHNFKETIMIWTFRITVLIGLGSWFLPWISHRSGLFGVSESAYDFALHYMLWLNLIFLLPLLFLKRFQMTLTTLAILNTIVFVVRFNQQMGIMDKTWSWDYGFYLHATMLILLLSLKLLERYINME